jgi:hypothetical protein
MRPLMLLLLSIPLLFSALTLVRAQTSTAELLLPPRAQWTWAHRLRAAEFASDCDNTVRAASERVLTDVLSNGRVRMSCHVSVARRLPGME